MVVFTPVSRWVPGNKWLLKVTHGKARLPDDIFLSDPTPLLEFLRCPEYHRCSQANDDSYNNDHDDDDLLWFMIMIIMIIIIITTIWPGAKFLDTTYETISYL